MTAWRFIPSALVLVSALPAAAPGPAPADQAEPELNVHLPDAPVIGESPKSYPFFLPTEIKAPNFSGHSVIEAQFPGHAFADGQWKGYASIGVMLDVTGKVTDYLVVRYTKSYFADSLLRAAKRETYQPRQVRGVAVPGPFMFTYAFAPPTRTVMMTSFDGITRREEEIEGGPRYTYVPHVEREVDGGQLVPTKAAIPELPAEYPANLPSPKLVLSFYVDESGHVHLPNVESAPSVLLIPAAVAAVQHWEFKPPTKKGKAVLVYASRVLSFRPPAAGTN